MNWSSLTEAVGSDGRMLPLAVTDAAIASELPGAMAWAERHHIRMTSMLPIKRIIRVVLVQGNDGDRFYLQGSFDDYKELPPVWDWRDASWSQHEGLQLSPSPQSTPFGSSLFLRHKNRGIICAPFNRLAYESYEGPHSDWDDPVQWMTAGTGHVYAVTIGDMLQAVLRDFSFTKGRMG